MEDLQISENEKYCYQKAIVIIYTCFLAVVFFSIIYRVAIRGILKLDESVPNTHISIDWAQRYPFQDTKNNDSIDVETREDRGTMSAFVDAYVEKVNRMKASLQWYCTDGFFLQQPCVELTAYVNRLCGTKIMRSASTLVDIDGGYLTTLHEKIDTQKHATNVAELIEFLEEEGISGVYVESLYKVSSENHHPLLYDDYTNRNADELLQYLYERNVSVLDLRKRTTQDMEYASLFFRTDTHWLPSTGLWAAREISEYLNVEYDLSLDIQLLSEERYQEKIYKKCFLGVHGRNIGLSYIGAEDFPLILPKFVTNFTYISEESSINKSGDFSQTFIEWNHLENCNYYINSCYDAYMGGRQACARIYNHQSGNELRVLFVSDSFGSTVAPFLALEFAQLDFIDPRLFEGSLESYIIETHPDIVIVMFNPAVIDGVDPDSNESIYMLR